MDDCDETVYLKKPVNLKDLTTNGMTFEVNYDDFPEGTEERTAFKPEDYLDLNNFDVMGLQDEEGFDDSEPFEYLATKMTDVDQGGYVKKRIIKQGKGEVVPPKSVVYFHYNAYLEYADSPFDSTYLRKKEQSVRLGVGNVLPGLDIGLQSMKFGEKAQFLIKPEYGYGTMGCFGRIPKNSTLFFEVELLRFVDSGATFDEKSDEKLSEDRVFQDIYLHAAGLCESGNDLVRKKQNYKAAIREYNTAVSELERSVLVDYDDQVKQQLLILRLRTNLVVCYMKIEKPKQCCTNCNRIYDMCRGTSLEIPSKVFYNNAKALIMLNDLEMAERRLRQAANRKRDDPDIVRLYLKLDKLKGDKLERDKMFARLLVGGSSVSDDFKKYFNDLCSELLNGPALQYSLPAKLTKQEEKYIEEEAKKYNLVFKKNYINREPKIYICKADTHVSASQQDLN